jgi:hypothetical protein
LSLFWYAAMTSAQEREAELMNPLMAPSEAMCSETACPPPSLSCSFFFLV